MRNRPDTSITKFIAGETYFININSCSFYELIAEKNPNNGMIRFETINNKDDTIIGYCASTYIIDTLTTNDISDYFQIHPSANCIYSSKKIGFITEIFDVNRWDLDKSMKAKINYHFLHGEIYDAILNKIYVTIDGYSNE